MIRRIEPRDIPLIHQLRGGEEREFGPDFLNGLVVVDSEDRPVMFAGAWKLAEVHMALDPQWGTPGARLAALQQLHRAMELELQRQDVGQVVTWFAADFKAFRRRLKALGWVESCYRSLHRKVG